MKYKLRHYQEAAIRDLWHAYSAGFKHPLIVAPTGAGKTVIACAIIEQIINKMDILFLAHRTELITQCSDKLREIGISHSIIKSGMDSGSAHNKVHVASIQTFARRMPYVRRNFGMIIVDEAHHTPATTYRDIIAYCNNPYVIGLTATPYRADGAPLGNLFDKLIQVADMQTLIGEGFLVPPRTFIARQTIDLSGIRTIAGDYDIEQLGEKMKKLKGHAINEYLRIAKGKRAIAFCCNVSHAKEVAESFCQSGIMAEHLDGTTPADHRKSVLTRLKSGKTLIVANCGVLTEGFDEPGIETIIGMRPTQSRGLWRQMLGRGARPCPEIYKQYFIVLDHCGWQQTHGSLLDPDIITLEKGLIGKASNNDGKKCKNCFCKVSQTAKFCPRCGATIYSAPSPGLGDPAYSLTEHYQQQQTFNFNPIAIPKPAPPMAINRIVHRKKGLEAK